MRFSPKLLLVPSGVVLALFFACRPFDEGAPPAQTNGNPPIVVSPAEGGPDGNQKTVKRACLDRPGVERAPGTGLPCELLPPGMTL